MSVVIRVSNQISDTGMHRCTAQISISSRHRKVNMTDNNIYKLIVIRSAIQDRNFLSPCFR